MTRETISRKQNKHEWDLQNYGTTKEEFNRKVNEILMQKGEEKNQETYSKQGEKEEEQL